MKQFFRQFAAFAVASSLCMFASCGKENNNDPTGSQEPADTIPQEPADTIPQEPVDTTKVFSVSPELTVEFSPGNLQYNPHEHLWRFAENQYDMIGADNSKIAQTYNGWIDLFGWGTSGYHNSSDGNNTNYAPYSYTKSFNSSNNYNATGYGPSKNMADTNLVGSSSHYDWGVHNNILYHGGNTSGNWRTLTHDEWLYLLNERHGATVSGVPNSRHANVMVNYVRGILLFPDNYVHPGNAVEINGQDINGDYGEYSSTHTNISASEWTVLENAGAIFLPAGGFRLQKEVKVPNKYGFYQTSTSEANGYSWYIVFQCQGDRYSSTGCNFEGRSVRLVKNHIQ